MNTLLADLRYATRMLRANPGFTATAVLTLALGIGANSAIFSVVNAVALRPLPYPEPEELVILRETKDDRQWTVAPGNFADWEERNSVFEALAAFQATAINLTGGDRPERVSGARVSPGFFDVLGIEPNRGRSFTDSDATAGQDRVAVLGHDLWTSRFDAANGVVGDTLSLDGANSTVIGITPPDFGFDYRGEQQLWVPLVITDEEMTDAGRDRRRVMVIGRLQDGVSLEQAQAEMDSIAARLAEEYPQSNTGWGVDITPLRQDIVGDVRTRLFFVLGAVGLVLLIACANVTSLLLARSTERHKELAVRSALGATRGRLNRQLFTETGLLALLGAGVGLLLAFWATRLLVTAGPGNIPRLDELSIDAPVLLFTLGIALVSALVSGLAPSWVSTRGEIAADLREGGAKTTASRGRQRLQALLVMAESALVMVLLICAGLALKSFLQLTQVAPGFQTEERLAIEIRLPPARYGEPREIAGFFRQVLDRVETLPGVRAAGAVSTLPLLVGELRLNSYVEGRPAPAAGEEPTAAFDMITPGYFTAMGIPLLQGRDFDSRDHAESELVLIVNQTFVEQLFGDESPLGQRISITGPEGPWHRIVGVVGDHKDVALDEPPRARMFQPHPQMVGPLPFMRIVVWTEGQDPTALAPAIRSAVWEVDKDQPIARLTTLDDLLASSIGEQRFTMGLLGGFSLVALILAMVGIYGVVSYLVGSRRQEVGIRMALGADKRDVLRSFVGRGLTPVALGVGLGLVAALGLTQLMGNLLFEVSPADPVVFLSLGLLLLAVGLAAVLLPSLRATRIDPMVSLRAE